MRLRCLCNQDSWVMFNFLCIVQLVQHIYIYMLPIAEIFFILIFFLLFSFFSSGNARLFSQFLIKFGINSRCDPDRSEYGENECHTSCSEWCNPAYGCTAGTTCYNDQAFIEQLIQNIQVKTSQGTVKFKKVVRISNIQGGLGKIIVKDPP